MNGIESKVKQVLVMTLAGSLSFAAAQANGAITAGEVETDIETATGNPSGSATYLDLGDSTTRDGATLNWTNFSSNSDEWGPFPDTSNGAQNVNGSGADDKDDRFGDDGSAGTQETDIALTISGLTPNSTFDAYVLGVTYTAGVDDGESAEMEDFSFNGTTYSDFEDIPGAVEVDSESHANEDEGTFAVPVGQVSTDANGSFSALLGNGDNFSEGPGGNRTLVDGVALVVPEPASLALFATGGLLILGRRRG